MKEVKNNLFLLFLIIPALFTGCATVEETLYLRQAEVKGPLSNVPIHLTDSSDTPSVTISPKFSFNTKKLFSGEIDNYTGSLPMDSAFIPTEHSLTWDVASVYAGVDFDIAFTKSLSLTFGVNYSTQNDFSTWGGNAGLGFFTFKNGIGFRFDAGVQINSMKYDAYTVRHTVIDYYWGDREEFYTFYHDVGTSTHFDPYFSLTFNTAYKNWPINIFFNGGYVVQTLFAFEPKTSYYAFPYYQQTKTDNRGSSTTGFINLTPGIFFNITEQSRVLAGCRFYIETQIDGANPKYFILPMMQFDFTL